MKTMEFEEMKRIWDQQNQLPLYTYDSQAIHHRILSKKRSAIHITNFSELMLIIVNLGSAGFVVAVNIFKEISNLYLYLMAGWMFVTALYSLISRVRRLRGEDNFERSMLGDLKHAINVATYQVRLSQIMRWNILPIGTLALLSVLGKSESVWVVILMLGFFFLVYWAGGWEHNIYKNKKRELEILFNKLKEE
ncbi:MAG: hypothetical protein HOP08_19630 [Cyclobacteriaceae bacterium]|nr:hypothetical protein [Cyclobacteriaceae bacterium]